MASNVQRGPNRMDASDWTRMLKLRGVTSYPQPGNPAPIIIRGVGKYTEFGLSRIQRPASVYTDYVAGHKLKYVLQTPANSCDAKNLFGYSICNCDTLNVIKHNGVCIKCKHDNIVTDRVYPGPTTC